MTDRPRALLVAADNAKSPSFASQVKSALGTLGFDVSTFNYRAFQLHRTQPTRSLVSKALLRRARSVDPAVTIVIKGESLLPGTIDAIRGMGSATANWTLDEPFGEFGVHNKVQTIPEYDCFYIFDDHYVKKLEAAGARRAAFLPLSSDPDLYREQIPWSQRKYLCDVSFIGSHYPNRERLLSEIADLDLNIWGYRWDRVAVDSPLRQHVKTPFPRADKRMPDLQRMCLLWNLSRTTINIHHQQSRRTGANLRVFDLMATKSFQLCDGLSGLSEVVGKDVIQFSDPQDLRTKIKYYAEEDAARNKLVERAYTSLCAKHTTLHRVRRMLDELGVRR